MNVRLRSLDAFRGMTIAGMTLVNNPGDWAHVYPALLHAAWHGWTPTDLVFPFFLFIVGVAIPFSLGARRERGATPPRLLLRVARRSLVLVALGLLLAAWPFTDLGSLRLPGVLQRIGVVYLVTGAAFLYLGRRGLATLAAVALVGYHALLALVPSPAGGRFDLDPETNLGAVLDQAILGPNLYQGTWDPEGILSTIPAVGSALIGVFAGMWLRRPGPAAQARAGLFAAGFGLLAAGWAWSFWLPINKNLWTSSYTVFTGGVALSCLALLAGAVDREHPPRWSRPLEALGRNAILIFVGSGLVAKTLLLFPARGDGSAWTWLWRNLFASWLDPMHASLGFALTAVALVTAVALALDRRGIHLRV